MTAAPKLTRQFIDVDEQARLEALSLLMADEGERAAMAAVLKYGYDAFTARRIIAEIKPTIARAKRRRAFGRAILAAAFIVAGGGASVLIAVINATAWLNIASYGALMYGVFLLVNSAYDYIVAGN